MPCVPRRRIRALVPAPAVAAVLSTLENVRGVEPSPQGIVVTYAGDDHGLAAIVRALVHAGVPVCGVEPERNELERIFMQATRGEVQ